MKKVLAILALTAMIAVASVANAATNTLQVTGTVNTSNVSIVGCTGALSPTVTPTVEGTATCAGTFTSNDLDGFTIDMKGDTATMVSTTPAGTIAGFSWATPTNLTCDAGEDCFAFLFDGTAFAATIDEGTTTYTTDPGANTDSYETGDHAIPTSQQVLVTSGDTFVAAGVYELEYTANVDNNVVASSDYQHDGDVYITAL